MCYLLREQKLGQMIVELDTEGLEKNFFMGLLFMEKSLD